MKATFSIALVCLFGLAMLAEGSRRTTDKQSVADKKPAADKKPVVDRKRVVKGKSVLTPSPKPPPLKPPGLIKPKAKNPAKTEAYVRELKKTSADWKTDPAQKAALGKLFANEPMTDQERQQLSDLLFNAQQAELSKEDETALSYLLLDETARHASAAPNAPGVEKIGPLFVRIHNNTGERLKVCVQVVPQSELKKEKDSDKPKESDKPEPVKQLETLVYNLEPIKSYDLQHNGVRLKATAIRVWALSPTRSWARYRDQELLLTTPVKSKTYTLTFSK